MLKRRQTLRPAAERSTITLEKKKAWTPMQEIKVPGPDERALVHHDGERLEWQVG